MALHSSIRDQIHFNVKPFAVADELMGLKTPGKKSLTAVFAECKDVDGDKFGHHHNLYECVKTSQKDGLPIKELIGAPYDERFKLHDCPDGVECEGCRKARQSLIPSAKLRFELECFGRPLGRPVDDDKACRPVPKFKKLPETYSPTSSLPVMPVLRKDLMKEMDDLLKKDDRRKKDLAGSLK